MPITTLEDANLFASFRGRLVDLSESPAEGAGSGYGLISRSQPPRLLLAYGRLEEALADATAFVRGLALSARPGESGGFEVVASDESQGERVIHTFPTLEDAESFIAQVRSAPEDPCEG